jgi:hypothetical protein
MSAIRVTSNATLRTSSCIFAAEGEHITTVATPIRTDIGQWFEAMRDAMIDFLFVALLWNIVQTVSEH